ncbi:hypothetical protein RvY_12459 [Ramazzottius varieornatus]|uniref:Kazal-like domain-containing protein n=1 Tax=Ramazzottius varieornatus TaxID=947166 RepID=A0A1D1VTC1_RAMVA|nr:hypothetical protein RvY_12459 [Ramazzottius varieornatus]
MGRISIVIDGSRLAIGLFLLCCLLSCHTVQGGVCWSTVLHNGRCRDLIQRDITQEECCKIGGGLAGWTEEDYDNGQTFFWSALGGGAPACQACSRSCRGIKCPEDQVCGLRKLGHPFCGCTRHCPASTKEAPLQPICSSENLSFKSLCHLKQRNCRQQLREWVNYNGSCQRSCDTVTCREDQHCILDADHNPYCVRCMTNCPDFKVPVCGTDGVTYDNMCHLNRASCLSQDKNITYAHRGSCRYGASCTETECKEDETCLLDNRHAKPAPRCVRCDLECNDTSSDSPPTPVCGSDGVTYSSWCQLRNNSCSFGLLIHVERIGPCLAASSANSTITMTTR